MPNVTDTKVVQVTVRDEQGGLLTFNIDNPKNDLTLNKIRAALQPAFNGGWWVSNKGYVINSLEKATYSESRKVPIGSEIVQITPPSLTVLVTKNGQQMDDYYINDGTVSIEGTDIAFVAITKTSGIDGAMFPTTSVSNNVITITVGVRTDVAYQQPGTDEVFSGIINIATNNSGNLTVPLIVNYQH